jgi:hypothetical protein
MAFNWDSFGKGTAAGGVGAGLFGGLFGGNDPSEEASKYIDQIPGRTKQYYEPFINAGKEALPTLQGQYGDLLNDPGGMVNKIGSGYKQSPGFQFALQKALAGGNRAFAAGGMGGSPAAANWGMETAEGLASQDYDKYLSHALSQYGLGLGGEEKLAAGGQQAGSSYGDMISQALAAQAKLKYEGQKAQNDFWPDIFSGAAKALPFFAGG